LFERTTNHIRDLVADIRDKEMILQPSGGPNHAAWTLGHIIHSCQAIVGELGVSPWLPDEWESIFGYGSLPRNVAGSAYSSRDVLTAYLTDACDRLHAALSAIDKTVLKDPLPDQDLRNILPTMGDALLQVICAHTAYHAEQLAAWRHAAVAGAVFTRSSLLGV
jgi:hypothetical protein